MRPLVLLSLIAGTSASIFHTHRQLSRRQAAESCSIGYCLENGGTRGGANATSVTVSDLAQLKTAASSNGSAVIFVDGTISGSADKVTITSDKTIFGKAGSGKPILCFLESTGVHAG